MAEKMKPCPFCGEDSVLMRPKRDNLIWGWLRKPAKDGYLAMCGNPSCYSKLHSFAIDPADAVAEWNAMCEAANKPMPCPICGADPFAERAGNGRFFICSNIECGFAKHCIPNPDMNAAAREWNKMISERNYLYNHPNDGVLKTKCMIENTPVVHEEFVNFLGGE